MPIYGESQDPWGNVGNAWMATFNAIGKQLEQNREREKREVDEAAKEASAKRAELEQMDPSERYAALEAYKKRWMKAPMHVQQAVSPILDAEFMKGTPVQAQQKAANVKLVESEAREGNLRGDIMEGKPKSPEEEAQHSLRFIGALEQRLGLKLTDDDKKYIAANIPMGSRGSSSEFDVHLNRFRDQVNAEAVPGGKPDQKMYDWGREIGYTPKDVDEVYATAAKEKSRKESVAKSDERPEIDKDFAAAGMGKTGGVKETKRQIGAVQARLLGTLGYDMVMTGGKDEEGNPAMISKKEIPAEAYAMTRLQAIKEVVGSNPKLLAAIKKHMPGELAGTGLEGESAAAPATPAANIDDIMGELNRRAAEKDGASKSKKPTSNYVEKR